MTLTTAQTDRACGVILGSAVGDALGAGYEFGCAAVGPEGPAMIGGGLGNFAPGEWTDDTAMTWPIAAAAAKGADLTSPEALDEIAQGFLDWYGSGPADIGNQTRAVFSSLLNPTLADERRPPAAGASKSGDLSTRMTQAAATLHERTGGNGSVKIGRAHV